MDYNTRLTLELIGDIVSNEPIKISVPYLAARKNAAVAAPAPTMRYKGNDHHMVPATTDRGGLRRHAVRMLRRSLDRTKPISINDAYYNIIGGSRSTGSTPPMNFAALESYKKRNPVIELFGAGDPFFMAGALTVSHIRSKEPVPKVRATQPVVRRDPLMTEDVGVDPTSLEIHTRYRQILAERAPYQAVIKTLKTEDARKRNKDTAKIDTILASLRSKTGDDSIRTVADVVHRVECMKNELDAMGMSNVSVQQALAGSEVIPAGTEFVQVIGVERASALAVGLFIECLRETGLRPRIGGGAAAGNGGRLERAYVVRVFNEADNRYYEDCTISIVPGTDDVMTITAKGPSCIAQQCLDLWRSAKLASLGIDLSKPILDKRFSAAEEIETIEDGEDSDVE